MRYQLALFDLDGTLLNSKKELSPANREAMRRCAEAGVHIVPATGRFYAAMPAVIRELPFVRYVVSINGAEVYDTREKKVLHRAEIPLEDALRVYDRLDTLPVIYDCYLDDWGYMDERMYARIDEFISDPIINQMVKTMRKPVKDFRGFLREKGRSLQKLQMFFVDMDARARALKSLPEEFPDMAVSTSSEKNIEVNSRDATKGEALRFLCGYLGIDIRDAMAFGDNSNDLTMLQYAGMGVAMANADPEEREAADYITDTNDNDGVAKALTRFCLDG